MECKGYELADKLNLIDKAGQTIFSVLRIQGGFSDAFMIIYFE